MKKVSSENKEEKWTDQTLFEYNIFSERLNELRMDAEKHIEAEKHKYSFEKLSNAIKKEMSVKITATQLSKYETSDNNPPMPTLNKVLAIADFFDVSIDYLIGRSDSKKIDYAEKLMNKKYKISDKAMDNLSEWKKAEDDKFNSIFPCTEFKVIRAIMESDDFIKKIANNLNYRFNLKHRLKDEAISTKEYEETLAASKYTFARICEEFSNTLYEELKKEYIKNMTSMLEGAESLF